MANEIKYRVAGHVFSVKIPSSVREERILNSYLPFRLADDDPAVPLFTAEVEIGQLPPVGELVQLSNPEPPFIWIYKAAEGAGRTDALSFGYSFDKDAPKGIVRFQNGDDWTRGRLTIEPRCPLHIADSCINNTLMLMYAYNTGWKDTLLLHASAPIVGGRGYVFMANSGTGKSTHSQMWLKNIEGTELLNDDNPVVRIVDGKAMLYGTPWSGKTPCYKNKCVPLGGAVKITRAPYNKCTRLNAVQAYAVMFPSCSSMRWNEVWNQALHKTIERVISQVPCWNMECLPDDEAARVCYETVSLCGI